jgi:hypothetical protein
MVAFLEFLSPVGEAIGLRMRFVATVAAAISQVTALSYKEAEVFFLVVLVIVLSEMARTIWNVITG